MRLPHAELALSAYYVVATAEASSNLARFDGVRYGRRAAGGGTLAQMMARTRGAGFGREVKRRILLGTYALRAGYQEAWYERAARVRRLVRGDFEAAFERVDLVVGPTAPTGAFELGAKRGDPLAMYLADVLTVPPSLAGLPAASVPCGSAGRPAGRPADRRRRTSTRRASCGPRAASRRRPRTTCAGPRRTEAGREPGASCDRARVNRAARELGGLEPVIGLEVHCQLATLTKLFCGCENRFGAPPNTLVCPVCTGQPGALPVANREALALAVRAALAVGAELARESRFDRKHYFYPDLPKGYQISQYERPYCAGGGSSSPRGSACASCASTSRRTPARRCTSPMGQRGPGRRWST